APDRGLSIDEEQVEDLEGLRAALHEMREQWAELHHFVASELFDVQLDFERRYRFAPFSLERFIGPLSLGEESHMGELIRRDDGQLEYLHSYRLSKAQTRRAWLLRQLSRHCWNLDATAVAVGSSREEFLRQLERAGFGYLLREGVLPKRRR
ncbi:MAG: hypothetical protein RBU37_26110, partial [Myxococcota bacterium]|nr:hypothetical protein [Myxococcota bacterium]